MLTALHIGSVQLWDYRMGLLLERFDEHDGLRKKNVAPGTVSYDESAHRASHRAYIFGSTDAIVKKQGMGARYLQGSYQQCVMYKRQEFIVSVAEDKCIRVWGMPKRKAVQMFRREHDRFRALPAHPELDLFAAGHDNGLIVFQPGKRAACICRASVKPPLYQGQVYARVQLCHLSWTQPCHRCARLTRSQFVQPRALSYNPAERAVLITSPIDGGMYELHNLPKEYGGGVRERSSEGKRSSDNSAIFIARNRFAVLEKANQTIRIRDLQKQQAQSRTGQLLLSTPTSVILFDVQRRRTISEVTTPPVKYVVWSADMSYAALLSKHPIIGTKSLEQIAAWDDGGILIYSTLSHIKYALPQGDNGIIRTLEQPIYLTRIKGKNVYCLDRDGKPRAIANDPTEYRFKQALTKRNYDEILHIIRKSNLIEQSIIAYPHRKGYPEFALHFVQEDKTRFDLALECGNLEIWSGDSQSHGQGGLLGQARIGDTSTGQSSDCRDVLPAYQDFDRLSFLYLATGNSDKLFKMLKIAELRGDAMSMFHNSLFLGNVEERIRLLREVGQAPLAYLTARTHGFYEIADEILESSVHDSNWPQLAVWRSYFEGAFTGDMEGVAPQAPVAMDPEPQEDQWNMDDEFSIPALDHKGASFAPIGNDPLNMDSDGGKDIDADLAAELHAETGAIVAKDSAFESAMQQGDCHWKRGMPPIMVPVRRKPTETDQRMALPVLIKNFQSLLSKELQEVYNATTSNKVTEACTLLRSTLHSLLLTIVTQPSEAEEWGRSLKFEMGLTKMFDRSQNASKCVTITLPLTSFIMKIQFAVLAAVAFVASTANAYECQAPHKGYVEKVCLKDVYEAAQCNCSAEVMMDSGVCRSFCERRQPTKPALSRCVNACQQELTDGLARCRREYQAAKDSGNIQWTVDNHIKEGLWC
ncbi:hypothetical protein EC968_002149 [Mortierella alpina]|nr:hypothetical protein EC968_002149 [Mortierella alpina]